MRYSVVDPSIRDDEFIKKNDSNPCLSRFQRVFKRSKFQVVKSSQTLIVITSSDDAGSQPHFLGTFLELPTGCDHWLARILITTYERVHFKLLEKKGKKREILCYYVRKSRMLCSVYVSCVLCVLSEVHSRDTYLPVHTPRTNFIGLYPGGTSWLHVYCT